MWQSVGFSFWLCLSTLCISSWDGIGIYLCCSPISPPKGAGDETILSWDVPLKCSGGTTHPGRCHWESACEKTEFALSPRLAWPQFPAEALTAPLGPNAFAPLRLPAPFEFEWTPILSCNFLCQFSNSTTSFLHGHIQGGDSYTARDCRN